MKARLNLEIEEDEKRYIKSQAALAGMTASEYVITKTIPQPNKEAMEALLLSDEEKDLRYYESPEQMFDDLHRTNDKQ